MPKRRNCSLQIRFILLVSLVIFISSCIPEAPPFLDAMESQQILPLPSESPQEWLLAFIDVETTGLLPGFHEMIDIGIAMTDPEGKLLDSLFLRIQPEHPERLSPGAFAVNAFDPERWRQMDAFDHAAAVDSIIAFHRHSAGQKHVLMVATNSHFDAAFLDHLFRSAGKTWRELYHYYILDLPSMAWGLGLRDLHQRELMNLYDVADEPHIAEQHTGITGALLNARIYRALLQYQKDHQK